ncbi:MAG: hypothetical protein U9P44_01135 [archaeon]|nr:hypothetical protein [archaeon]
MAESGKNSKEAQAFPLDFKGRTLYHLPLDRETNRPTRYIVAGTPGEPTIPQMYQYQGLAGKIVKGAKEGYDFIELDLWNDAEILEPHLAERIKQIREIHRMDVGLHLRVNLDLTSALGPIWGVNHKSLLTGVVAATEVVKANFILMHSAATPILEFGEAVARTAPNTLLTPWNNNLADFIQAPLCFDNEARRRLLSGKVKPRLRWNLYSADEKGILDEEKRNKYRQILKPKSEENKEKPTLKEWALSKFIKDIWFPGTVPQAEVMVSMKDVKTMQEVHDGYKNAFKIVEKWFNRSNGKWRKLWDNATEKRANKLEPLRNIIAQQLGTQNFSFLDTRILTIAQSVVERLLKNEKKENEIIKLKDNLKNINELYNLIDEYSFYVDTILKYENQGHPPKSIFQNFFEDIIDIFKRSVGHDTRDDEKKIRKSMYPFITGEDKDNLEKDIKELDEVKEKNYIKIIINYERYNVEENFTYWVQKGAEAEEQVAYRTIGKWMYVTRDPLYEKIIIDDKEIKTWWEKNKKEVIKHKNELYADFKSNDDKEQMIEFLDPDNIIAYTNVTGGELNVPIRKMVAAISAKYIQGHLDEPMEVEGQLFLEPSRPGENVFKASIDRQLKRMYKEPDKGNTPQNRKSIYKYMHDCGIHFYIETQDVLNEEWRGKVRIMSLTDHIAIIKAFYDHYNFDNVSYTMDFEHLTGNLLNPQHQIEQLEKGDAKYISMIHINPPSAAQGLHKVLKRMSFDIEYIYRWLYKLRSIGMSGAYFVWEMGKDTGGGTYEAPLAIRGIAKELAKGTKPQDLPDDFFGIDANFRAMQIQAINAHGLDPIRDMFFYKPLDHTFTGQFARATNAEIAEKEKYR